MLEQNPNVFPEYPALQGKGLVARLNKLAEDGVPARGSNPARPSTLEKAFSEDEQLGDYGKLLAKQRVNNLRESADILDRIQRTHVGKGEEAAARPGGGHFGRVGATGIGATVLGAAEIMHGGGAWPVAAAFAGGAGVVELVRLFRRFSDSTRIKVMTSTEGVVALKAVETAKTPIQWRSALNTLSRIAASKSIALASRERLKQLQAETAQLQAQHETTAHAPAK